MEESGLETSSPRDSLRAAFQEGRPHSARMSCSGRHHQVGDLRLEAAACEGHSLAMLKQIDEALNKHVEIHFVPAKTVRVA